MTEKTCLGCNLNLPILQFYVHKAMSDGYLNYCKQCVKARVSKHRNDHLEEARLRDRIRFRSETRRSQIYAHSKALRIKYPEKYKARTAVGNAVRLGKLVRLPCWCGDSQSQAHHHDYSKPLDVIWLCQKHHDELHHPTASSF